jgi:dihydrolipoamide dehydrogenase
LQETRPEKVVIIGAGAIGVEFATVWSSYGTQVTIVEMLPRVLPLEDEEASAELARAFKKRGVELLTSTKVLGIEKTAKGVVVKVGSEVVRKPSRLTRPWLPLVSNPTQPTLAWKPPALRWINAVSLK